MLIALSRPYLPPRPPGRLAMEVHLAPPASWRPLAVLRWAIPTLSWARQWGGLLEIDVRLGLGLVVYVGVSPRAAAPLLGCPVATGGRP